MLTVGLNNARRASVAGPHPGVRTDRRAWGRVAAAALLNLLALAGAAAHEGRSAVRAALGELPPELGGVKVELHETLAPQLTVENRTGKPLEILDDRGVPFLRIGPGGVEANLAAPDWYRTYSPGATAPPARDGGGPRWARVSSAPAWGWFDLRIRTDWVKLPPAAVRRKAPAEVGQWEVPMRLAGRPTALRGVFRYEPPPRHVQQAGLTSPPEIAPGVQVTLLQGRVPGLFLQNRGGQTVTVLGRADEPFLRFGPGGVEANTLSPAWRELLRARGHGLPGEGALAVPPRWETVSKAAGYGWLEFRAQLPGGAPPGAPAVKERRWEVPILVGDRRALITGTTLLKPAFRAELTTAPGRVTAGEPAKLTFTVRDAAGLIARNLEIVHEKPMHLFIVSDDLSEYAHIHPEAQADGSYSVTHTFPRGGAYRLYADFTPPGAGSFVEMAVLQVAGNARSPVALPADPILSALADRVRVTLSADKAWRVGAELTLGLAVTDVASGRPVTDLEPYLGAMAHVVIISEDGAEFLHAHPAAGMGEGGAGAPAGHAMHQAHSNDVPITAVVAFPRAGRYKVWAQFQRRGQVITVPFVVRVGGEAARR